MSAVARIELYHVAVPLPARFCPSWIPGFPQTENRFTVLNKMGEPIALEQAQLELQGLIARLEEELFVIRGDTTRFNRVLRSREEQLSKETKNVARLRGDMTDIQGQYKASRQLSEIQDILQGRLVAAQQELTAEMKRLQARQVYRRPPESPVALK